MLRSGEIEAEDDGILHGLAIVSSPPPQLKEPPAQVHRPGSRVGFPDLEKDLPRPAPHHLTNAKVQ